MKYISDLAKNYPASGIRAMYDLAEKYPDAINLTNGEPNFDTPEHIKQAAIKAIQDGFTKYGTEPGLYELREAIADKYTNQFGIKHKPQNTMVTVAGVEGILLSFMTLLNPGDEVIIPDPAYTCYLGQAQMLSGKVVRVPLYEEHGFILQPKDLERVITPRTKALVITNPNNPLGTILTKEAAEKIADVIERHNIIVISDEVYEKIIFDDREHFSLAQIPRIRNKVLVVNSFSKTYAMTGWRVGYVVGDEKILANMFKLQQAVASTLPIFVQKAAIAALRGSQDVVAEMKNSYERRRNILFEGLNEIPGLKCAKPQGSFCIFANIKEFDRRSFEFTKDLLTKAGVIAVGGDTFGHMGEGYVRFCFANSDEDLKEAVERLKEYIPNIQRKTNS